MRKEIVTAVCILFSVFYSSAQSNYQLAETLDFFNSNKMVTGDWKQSLTANEIKGSPFLNDEFIKGTIYTTSKYQFRDIPLRYNIYNHDLEFRTPQDQVLAMATPEIVEKAVFGEYTMTFIPYSVAKKIKRSFFVVIEEGEASLYVQPQVSYQAPKVAAAYKDPEPAKFIKKPDAYFIRIGQEAAVKVANKKEVPFLFPDHQKEITSFIKKNKIKINKAESLQKLVQYYNSL